MHLIKQSKTWRDRGDNIWNFLPIENHTTKHRKLTTTVEEIQRFARVQQVSVVKTCYCSIGSFDSANVYTTLHANEALWTNILSECLEQNAQCRNQSLQNFLQIRESPNADSNKRPQIGIVIVNCDITQTPPFDRLIISYMQSVPALMRHACF